ncbi:MAG TPA: helix-turn-helix transcriptional regulator [Thermoleophilia bacterium]|nr:helix-turn-helix transcriptional regulator [Thermoleophilia bacterium]
MTPGQNIAARRAALGITQAEAARRMGCSQSYWADIEANRKSPSVRTLERIAKALGCTVADLVA